MHGFAKGDFFSKNMAKVQYFFAFHIKSKKKVVKCWISYKKRTRKEVKRIFWIMHFYTQTHDSLSLTHTHTFVDLYA